MKFNADTFNVEDARKNLPIGNQSCKVLADRCTDNCLNFIYESSIRGKKSCTYYFDFNHQPTIIAVKKRIERRGFTIYHSYGQDVLLIYWDKEL